MSISEEEIIKQVEGICTQAIEAGTHQDLTVRGLIQKLIDDFKHEPELIQSKSIKKLIKLTAAKALQPSEESNSKTPPPPPAQDDEKTKSSEEPAKESKSPKTDIPKDPSSSSKPPSKKRRRASSKSRFKSSEMIDSDGNSMHEDEDSKNNNDGAKKEQVKKDEKPTSKKPRIKKEKKVKSNDQDDATTTPQEPKPSNSDPNEDKSADDGCEVKSKSQTSISSKKAGKAKKEPLPIDKDEEKIKKLKSFVVACGVRKQWKKELQDCTNKTQQITHLTKMLQDLGMKGRMSMAQAKEIKARRDLEAEVNELAANHSSGSSHQNSPVGDDADEKEGDQDLKDPVNESASGSKKVRKNRTVNDSSDGLSDDETIKKPHKPKKNPFAFLGDQGSEDSS